MKRSFDFEGRLGRVRKGMAQDQLPGMLFTDLANLFYLTGFRGSDGILLVTPSESILLVDGRYGTQAKEQAPHCRVVVYPAKNEAIIEQLRAGKFEKLGFEPKSVRVEFYQTLTNGLPGIQFRSPSAWHGALRAIKDNEEIKLLREANRIADDAVTEIFKIIREGVSERDIAIELEYQMKKRGAEGASFPILVATGDRAALPHAMPTDRKLKTGDFFFIDFGCTLDGYQTDQTLTISLGKKNPKLAGIYEVVKEAHDRAIQALRPGILASEVDAVARNYIAEKGYAEHFSHSLGHGVGIEVHEFPTLATRSTARLEAGMVVTIEPGIYLPGFGGVRIEDALFLKSSGAELLTSVDKGLLQL